MIIRELQPVGKNRIKIVTDDAFAFVLYKGELPLYHLEVGAELSDAMLHTIYEEILYKRVKLRAMKLLLQKRYTKKQLKDKLLQGGYPEEVADHALSYVSSFHYVDDDSYIADYIRAHQAVRSRKEIEQKLFQRGISHEEIERVYLQLSDEGELNSEEEAIKILFEKKHFKEKISDKKERDKCIAFFLRKGFSSYTVLNFIKKAEQE